MKLLSGVLSLNSCFWMIIYLYGLHTTDSVKYNPIFVIVVICLLALSIYCFYLYHVDIETQKHRTNKSL